MASLVCWASGLLSIMADKDVPQGSGPVVLMTGTAGRLRSMMVAHGKYIDEHKDFYVPGTQDVPTFERSEADVQHDRMTLVIAFGKRLHRARLKQKGVRHVKEIE